MPELIMKGVLGGLLLSGAIQDVFIKKINTWIVVTGAILTCVCLPFCHSVSLSDRAFGAFIGGGVMLLSKATGGKIGMGDGFLLCVTGIGLGFWGNMELFALSLFAASIVSVILLVFRLADRKKSIPFIPFLLLGYVVFIFTSWK